MSLQTYKVLDYKCLEHLSTLESVEIETYVCQLLCGNFFSIDHDIKPFMLEKLTASRSLFRVLCETLFEEIFNHCAVLPVLVQMGVVRF